MAPRRFVFSRLTVLALVAGFALALRVTRPPVPAATLEGLASLLGHSVGKHVSPRAIGWEPASGFVLDALLGRRVLFLASEAPGGPRDLHRAWVRVGLDGKPSSVARTRNLTRTALGDDSGLVVRGQTAVIATRAYGRLEAVSVLDLSGPRAEDLPGSWFERMRVALTAFRRTGTLSGIGRTDMLVDLPADATTIRLGDERVVIDLGGPSETIVFDLSARTVVAPKGASDARTVVRPARVGPTVAWVVNEVRAIVGPDPIARLEAGVFGARETMRRAAHAMLGGATAASSKASPDIKGGSDVTWPPPAVAPALANADPEEGKWKPVERDFLREPTGLSGAAPAYFQRTWFRPNPERPYAEVHLVALDMRQLEVRMVAGYEEPEPVVGPPGTGRLPEDPDEYERVVATFNGAFKSTHGPYGMMVDRRVLVPPVVGAATIVRTHVGSLGFGTWPDDKSLPGNVVSFRQNLDPLVADGVENPRQRAIWGWHLAGRDVHTERTALCVTASGQVLYAWATEISGPELARALARAGCDYAVHLDMNPTHCGFVFTRIDDLGRGQAVVESLHPGMSGSPTRYIGYSPKDFFYVRVRDVTPPSVRGASWRPLPVPNEPDWLPGVYEGKLELGDLEVRLLSFENGRFEWVVRAGQREPSVAGGAPKKITLEEGLLGRARAAMNLGRTTQRTGYGLAFGPRPSLELRRAYATLVLTSGEPPELLGPGQAPKLEDHQQAVQLPLIADEGRVLPAARVRGARRRRGALCVTPFGRLLYAEVEHDSDDPLGGALARAGCQRIAGADRGSRHEAFAHIAGVSEPPSASYETTVLYALARPAKPNGFSWRPESTPERRAASKEP